MANLAHIFTSSDEGAGNRERN